MVRGHWNTKTSSWALNLCPKGSISLVYKVLWALESLIFASQKTNVPIFFLYYPLHGLERLCLLLKNLALNSAQRKTHFQVEVSFQLELHLLWTHRVQGLTNYFAIFENFWCLYLGTSHFGYTPIIFEKLIILEFKYLQNKKWQEQAVTSTGIRRVIPCEIT